jgi:hypothetical protein
MEPSQQETTKKNVPSIMVRPEKNRVDVHIPKTAPHCKHGPMTTMCYYQFDLDQARILKALFAKMEINNEQPVSGHGVLGHRTPDTSD